ncbi:hypothetical protein ACQFX9_10760 [Aliinostoc sp. HNIBRCY26]|uniref:hypothetical protein n=1 Tax=Aliinostoc sp. HNIBRCY26 TaxID=3418997 RepID=UPI003D08AA42
MLLSNQQLTPEQLQLTLPDQIIEADTLSFADKFNGSPFMFSHNLGNHSLSEITHLVELAKTLMSQGGRIHCQSSEARFNQKAFSGGNVTQDTILNCLTHIEESASWLLLYSVQSVPEYRVLLETVVAELEEIIGLPLRQDISWQDVYIFVASPHAVTPYHFDHESTFLFQIYGQREAHLFPFDPSTVSTEELEKYYFGDPNAGKHTNEKQHKAHIYTLSPGKGVHIPVRSPHYFKNGNSYSVVLGVHFDLHSYDWQVPIHQVNFILRKLGLQPKQPGQSALSDQLKTWLMRLISKRCPKNKYEFYYSGVDRIKNPIKSVVNIFKRLK